MRKVIIMSIALLSIVLVGCNGNKKTTEVAESKLLVKVASTTQQSVEQLVEFTGNIQPFIQNTIAPSSPVRIEQILVEVGDKVKKGQLLVKMDQTAYRQASVQLANLETDYQRLKTVYEASGISKQQLDAQYTQLEVARAQVENLLENIELRSPISGIVTARLYDQGDLFSVSPKNGVSGILTLMQIDKLKIQINVSETYFPSVKLGMPVDIKSDLFPGETFKGKTSLIYPSIDPSTRTFAVEVTIPNSTMKLRPGMFSRVALNFGVIDRVVMPDLALQRQAGTNERYVYILENGAVRRSSVVLGRQMNDVYEVISGVNQGDEVVIAGASKLMDGSAVEIVK